MKANNVIQTYQVNGKWCVRVHGKMLCGTSKTQKGAQGKGEWFLNTQSHHQAG